MSMYETVVPSTTLVTMTGEKTCTKGADASVGFTQDALPSYPSSPQDKQTEKKLSKGYTLTTDLPSPTLLSAPVKGSQKRKDSLQRNEAPVSVHANLSGKTVFLNVMKSKSQVGSDVTKRRSSRLTATEEYVKKSNDKVKKRKSEKTKKIERKDPKREEREKNEKNERDERISSSIASISNSVFSVSHAPYHIISSLPTVPPKNVQGVGNYSIVTKFEANLGQFESKLVSKEGLKKGGKFYKHENPVIVSTGPLPGSGSGSGSSPSKIPLIPLTPFDAENDEKHGAGHSGTSQDEGKQTHQDNSSDKGTKGKSRPGDVNNSLPKTSHSKKTSHHSKKSLGESDSDENDSDGDDERGRRGHENSSKRAVTTRQKRPERPTFEGVMRTVRTRDPHEFEFHQAVEEVLESVWPFLEKNPKYLSNSLLERIIEPERVVSFRISWVDDKGKVRVNRGYRVQMNSSLGPYKGGLRFHPSVTLSVLKFLAFEQVFKNSLTTLPMGGAKGGADFNPRGKSDGEIMRFCQAFMTELYRHVGPNTDVPAGDIGVGGREIGYMYGQYKRVSNRAVSVLTGKGLSYGGSRIRPEATGYGAVYFLQKILGRTQDEVQGKRFRISGAGNVAQYAALKVIELGGLVTTMSDSDGTIFSHQGLTKEQWERVCELKNVQRGRFHEMDLSIEPFRSSAVQYFHGQSPWELKQTMDQTIETDDRGLGHDDNSVMMDDKADSADSGKNWTCDVAMPCATQNEINLEGAKNLIEHGCFCVVEGANMPCNLQAVEHFIAQKIIFAPGKAANAGGVTVSGLEMSQNAMRLAWDAEEVDKRLQCIMSSIHDACIKYGEEESGYVNYVVGANIAGFVKVADAMISQGII